MRVTIYFVLGVLALVLVAVAIFALKVNKIPPLSIPENVTESEKIELIDKWFQILQSKNKFNGSVLLAKEGEPLLLKAYGYVDHTKKGKLSANSSMRLASVSKQFTAAGVMLLKEKGLFNYDDLVSKHIEGFPYQTVTIRHMLNQTSGIPDYISLAENKPDQFTAPLTNQSALQLLKTYESELTFTANEKFEYNNSNYIMLSLLVETVSSQSFESYMQENIFGPLGMEDSRVWNLLSKEKTFKNKTSSFFNVLGKFIALPPTDVDGVAGDGAVFSSAADMLIWDQFWYGNDILSDENIQEAFTEQTLNDGSKTDYGFGWIINDKSVWHNGSWLGARTFIGRNTERKTCTLLLDNSGSIFLDRIIAELRKANNSIN